MGHVLNQLLGVLVGIAVPLASFATGLRSKEPLWLCHRPRLLVRSLAVILLIVPVVEVLLAQVLSPGNSIVRAGIVVSILAVGIGPPALLRHAGDPKNVACYEIGLNVALMTLAVVYLPVAVAVHGAIFQHELALPWPRVARVVLVQAILPFFAGVLIARRVPKAAAPLGRYAPRFVGIAIATVAIVAILAMWRQLLALGPSGWLACATVVIMALLIGHFAGGPDRETRAVLAEFSAIRFPALALLLATIVPAGTALIPVVLAYAICSALLVAVYRAATTRREEAATRRRTGPVAG
jgi:predicted Na+-dependent transporter